MPSTDINQLHISNVIQLQENSPYSQKKNINNVIRSSQLRIAEMWRASNPFCSHKYMMTVPKESQLPGCSSQPTFETILKS